MSKDHIITSLPIDAYSDRGREILEKRDRLRKALEDVRHAEYELAKAQAWLAYLEAQES